MLRSGTPTAQASATPSRASAQAPASNANDTSAAETTAQLMTAEKNSPKPEGNAAVATSGSAPAASGGTGPDIMGLRIGMTGDEARAIFKSRILVSDDLRQAYRESSATLGFIDGGSLVSVPNGKYLQDMAVRRNPTNSWWSVGFEPVPGHERIQSIMWQIAYPRDNYPTFDVFEKTLAEKYGPPTGDFRRPSAVDRARARGINSMFYWIYDSNGTLRIPGSGNVSECLPWRGINDSALVGPIETQTLEPDFSAKCGAIFFTVYMMLEDPLNPGPKTLVTGHETRMTGFDAALHGAKVAGAIIGKIQTDAKEAAIKKGQQQKPAF